MRCAGFGVSGLTVLILTVVLTGCGPAGEAGTSGPTAAEDCQDNLDNDGDGLTDCDDTDCEGQAACAVRFRPLSDGGDSEEEILDAAVVQPDRSPADRVDESHPPEATDSEVAKPSDSGSADAEIAAEIDTAACVPDCTGRQCGPDGCNGYCGVCQPGLTCDALTGQCTDQCQRNCDGRQCGPDSCGGFCGSCAVGWVCDALSGQCTPSCQADCTDRQCGDDGCGGVCGLCGEGTVCDDLTRQCLTVCQPQCEGRQCGGNGCGGTCGSCPVGDTCYWASGQCESTCQANCTDRQCGDNGCGQSCGTCAGATVCNEATGQCEQACQPNCAGRQCGDNGCGQPCGTCPANYFCMSGQCSGPAGCHPLNQNCPIGQGCYPADPLFECYEAGPGGADAACYYGNDCSAGFVCASADSTCRQLCSADDAQAPRCADCATGYFAHLDGSDWLGVCIDPPSSCNPLAQDCQSAEGCYPTSTGPKCFQAGNGGPGQICSFVNDCVSGSLCMVDSICHPLCDPANPQCSAAMPNCTPFDDMPQYGACNP